MKLGLLSDIFMSIRDWIYSWDTVTFAITMIVLILLIFTCLVTFIKALMKDKGKFKFIQLIFIALLVAMIVIICVARK